jgi:hypothetical protein
MLRSGFWDDPKMGRLSREARLLYAGTWNLADDVGNVRIEPAFLRANLFAYDQDLTLDEVDSWLRELLQLARLVPYEVEGERYAQIPKFLVHQKIDRPSKWRWPTPDTQICVNGEESTHTRHTLASRAGEVEVEVEVEVEREVEVEVNTLSPASQDDGDEFDGFWAQFPPDRQGKRVDKAKARAAWFKLPRDEREAALVGVGFYRQACEAGRYAKQPLTWLHGKCWVDWQEAPVVVPTTTNGNGHRSQNQINADAVARRMGLNPADTDPFGTAPDEPWRTL